MKQNRKTNVGTGLGMSVLWGSLTSMCITVCVSMVIAALIYKEKISELSTGYGVMICLMMASYAGSYIACKRMGGKLLTTGLLTGTTYISILLAANALLFEGKYHGVGETVLLILCGCSVAVMWTSRDKTKKKSRKHRFTNC